MKSGQAPQEIVNEESQSERLERLFKSVVTNLASITIENELRRVKLKEQFEQKNKIFEEQLQRLSEQQKQLEQDHEEVTADNLSFTSGFTEMFEKMKQETQEKLDKVTAEILRTEDETERFIEQTKDFQNSLKAMEGKKVVAKGKAEKKQAVKKQANCKFNKEEVLASIKSS